MFHVGVHVASLNERAAVLALARATKTRGYETAALIDRARSAEAIVTGEWGGFDPYDSALVRDLFGAVGPREVAESRELIETQEKAGIRVLTILDKGYPQNLRAIYNQPPVLFVKGAMKADDERAVAVVGTRSASPERLATSSATCLPTGSPGSDSSIGACTGD